jgi:hypothetical protein
MVEILTIKQYFEKGLFIIPAYQRGYKWGVAKPKEPCAVEVLMKNIISAFKEDAKEYFIQGVTVYEDKNADKLQQIHLIDGQQRTTTFFLLLHALGQNALLQKKNEQLTIQYLIRKDSQAYLNGLVVGLPQKEAPDIQDIFYFDKALKTIRAELNNIVEAKKKEFVVFVLNHIKLMYITTNSTQATKTFSMLNGQKAEMSQEELIKSALLSKASRANHAEDKLKNNNTLTTKDWEINALREKYAREWDKWLYWWHRKEVKDFFNTDNPMGLLLKYYFIQNTKSSGNKDFNFKNFKNEFLDESKTAKKTFKALRDLQKTFEDWFNDPKIYNHLGIILKTKPSNRREVLLYLLGTNKIDFLIKIKDYTKWALIGATHKEIIDDNKVNQDSKIERAIEVLRLLKNSQVYNEDESKNHAYKQLLRRNMLIDVELGRKFDFECWSNRSLEHIHPQSKADDLQFDPKQELSIHSIGNLVLLYGNDNSAFKDSSFNEKKQKYFSPKEKNYKKSLHLLHSVTVFATEKWDKTEIERNQNEFINEFKKFYNI